MLHARAEGARRERVLGFADHELDVGERARRLRVACFLLPGAFFMWENVGLTLLAGRETAERRSRAI